MLLIASESPPTYWSRTCACEPLDERVEALARRRLQEVVLLRGPRIRSPTAGGSASSWSSRRLSPPDRGAAARRAGVGRRTVRAEAGRAGARCPSAPRRRSPPAPWRTSPEHVVQLPVALEQLLARAEAIDQVTQAGHVRAGRRSPPATLHEPPQRPREVALGHEVVGERVEDLVGVEVRHRLGCRPSASSALPGPGRQRARRPVGDRPAASPRPGRRDDPVGSPARRHRPVLRPVLTAARRPVLVSRRCRCSPSRMNSTADARRAGASAPSRSTPQRAEPPDRPRHARALSRIQRNVARATGTLAGLDHEAAFERLDDLVEVVDRAAG